MIISFYVCSRGRCGVSKMRLRYRTISRLIFHFIFQLQLNNPSKLLTRTVRNRLRIVIVQKYGLYIMPYNFFIIVILPTQLVQQLLLS